MHQNLFRLKFIGALDCSEQPRFEAPFEIRPPARHIDSLQYLALITEKWPEAERGI